jgi:hypothetical protein
MNKTFASFSLSLALLLCASGAFAQQILSNTTLSAAAVGGGPGSGQSITTTGLQTFISVASATNITAPAPVTALIQTPAVSTFLFVDRELMDVRGVSGTTILVVRGALNTMTTSHASGAVVFVIPGTLATWINGSLSTETPALPAGSCLRSAEYVLPRIYANLGILSDCLGGQWHNSDSMQTTFSTRSFFPAPAPGGVAYTTLNTNGTTLVAGTEYCTEVFLPESKLLTGIGVMNGTTVGTDNHLVALYDSGGNLIANSAVAGVLAASASTYQTIAFTGKYFAVGPAQYFGCVQSNGTTATVRMVVTGTQDNIFTTSKTGVFGTLPAIVAPTTFTTAVGPYVELN